MFRAWLDAAALAVSQFCLLPGLSGLPVVEFETEETEIGFAPFSQLHAAD